MSKLRAWLQSDEPIISESKKEAFKAGAKKIIPWLVGGAAAVGGVIVGYKMMNKDSDYIDQDVLPVLESPCECPEETDNND